MLEVFVGTRREELYKFFRPIFPGEDNFKEDEEKVVWTLTLNSAESCVLFCSRDKGISR